MEVGSTKRGDEIVERLLVRQIDCRVQRLCRTDCGKRCGAQLIRADRSGGGRIHATAEEAGLELLIRRYSGDAHDRVGPVRAVRAVPSRARRRALGGAVQNGRRIGPTARRIPR